VFANLLNNAAKYSEIGGQIWLRAEPTDNEIVVSVRDTGIGITADQLPQIFDMFAQAAPTLEQSKGGLGIGLSLARGLVELHGGSIEAQSGGAGLGSKFIIRLPIEDSTMCGVRSAESVTSLTPDAALRTPHPARRTLSCRILVVDDNEDAADSLSILLQLTGHDIRTAQDGHEAVQAATAFKPDIVLLDIGLPKMNGYEVARILRQEPWSKRMTLIAMTGWGQDEDKRRALEAGFDHHLTKPVDPTELLQLLESVAGRRAENGKRRDSLVD
jgi:CheY-like chemotaxis protein